MFQATGRRHDAEDLTQETFLAAHRGIGRYAAGAPSGTVVVRRCPACPRRALAARGSPGRFGRRIRRRVGGNPRRTPRNPSRGRTSPNLDAGPPA
ncbi:MAG: sigma factor [Limisphaerales bacterium]